MKLTIPYITLLATLGLATATNLLPPQLSKQDIILPNVFQGSFRLARAASENYQPGVYNVRFFDQSITHSGGQTFKQRYYVNADHYKPGGPAFLYISGESALYSNLVSGGLAVYLAKKHNGIVYALEHRYYGISLPFKNLTADNLKYLSSDYGLKDLATFASKVQNPITNKKNGDIKWYAIGGSYAGNMAAWIRQDRPDLFDGAISSSGPVEAKSDFYDYDLSIGSVIGEECLNNVNEVTQYIDNLYEKNKAKFNEIKNYLGCGNLNDDIQFLYTVADTLAAIVQYNSPTSNPSVKSFCNGFKNAATTEAKLKNAFDTFLLYYRNTGNTCYKFSSEDDLLNPRPGENSIMRQWNYQCCTEFGYWQTAPSAKVSSQKSTRSKYLTVNWFNQFFCSERYYGKYVGTPNTDHINSRHAGKNIDTDRIIFTNGNSDPWAKLSVNDVTQSRNNRPVLVINGGSHVVDLGTPNPNNSQSLRDTHNVMIDTIGRWINQPSSLN